MTLMTLTALYDARAEADRAVSSVRFGTEASKYGFKVKWDASTQGDTFVDAVWAYTAP